MLLKIYIVLCGLTLILAGILGFVNNIHPAIEPVLFGDSWYSDNTQNTFHIALGIFTLLVGALASKRMQKILAWVFSLLSMGVAVYSLYSDTLLEFFGLEKPGDTFFYLLLGSAGLIALTITIISDSSKELEELRRKLKV